MIRVSNVAVDAANLLLCLTVSAIENFVIGSLGSHTILQHLQNIIRGIMLVFQRETIKLMLN